MNIESVAINSITSDPVNARMHDRRNIDAIMSSLVRFGQQKPIVVDCNGVVRAGNGTLSAARALGWKQISIVRSDLPLNELAAYAVADNRTAEFAEWDTQILTGLLTSADLGDVGFTNAEIEAMLGVHADEDEDNDDPLSQLQSSYEVVIECRDEPQQKKLYERLHGEGYSCRLFTL